jgi:KRAB domain-containing zinc finger protein
VHLSSRAMNAAAWVGSRCDLCKEDLLPNEKIEIHMEMLHPDAEPYTCNYCSQSFWSKALYNIHRTTHLEIAPIKRFCCEQEFCIMYYTTLKALRNHREKRHSLTKDFQPICQECSKTFETELEMKKHQELHYICIYCGKMEQDSTKLYGHVAGHKRKNEGSCQICGKYYANLSEHLKHHPEYKNEKIVNTPKKLDTPAQSRKKFECDQCFKRSISLSALRSHRKKEHNLSHFAKPTCLKCAMTFETDIELKNHIKMHAICPLCGASFPSEKKLERHHKIVHKETQYQSTCETCGKSFKTLKLLNRHLKIHTAETTLHCDICDFSCKLRGGIYQHMLSHIAFVALKCRVCRKRFRDMDSLNGHELLHLTEDRPTFKCMICDKSFKKKQGFEDHLKRHSGDLPFKCERCDSAFLKRCGLRRHMWQMHQEKCYECTTCGEKFINGAHLNSHKAQVHIQQGFRLFRS